MNYSNQTIKNITASEGDWSEHDFNQCLFQKYDFSQADFSGSDLLGSRFQLTNLERVNFVKATNYAISPANNKLRQAHFAYPEALSLLTDTGIKIDL